MKKLNNTFAAVAVALGIGLTSHANAVIEMESNGVGDALLFPVFNGYIENYFTVSNHSNLFVQGHLRFRGAAWSGELRDFDVILTPGDVLVFRVADLDGDGYWEIDQSLDVRTSAEKANGDKPKTFENNGMVFYQCDNSGSPCLKPSEKLLPSFCYTEITDKSTDIEKYRKATCEHHRHVGYVEFIGEAVLDNMTHEIMQVLVDHPESTEWKSYVTENGNKHGTSAWKWADAEPDLKKNPNGRFTTCVVNQATGVTNNPCDRGLSDVGNWLSGTAFLTIPGQTHGVAYNAEAFNNFRTASFKHRIDNYVYHGSVSYNTDAYNVTRVDEPRTDAIPIASIGEPTAVILHHENGDTSEAWRDYVYGCPLYTAYPVGDPKRLKAEQYQDEEVVSFNNTWGPTLADGDDTGGIVITPPIPHSSIDGDFYRYSTTTADIWDTKRFYIDQPPINVAITNSISEVEAAIAANGQVFYSYYFDQMPFDSSSKGAKANLTSYYIGLFPTKFFYGERASFYDASNSKTNIDDACKSRREAAILHLLNLTNNVGIEIWNTNEQTVAETHSVTISPDITPIGCIGDACSQLGLELNNWDIKWLKTEVMDNAQQGGVKSEIDVTGFQSGRAVISILDSNEGFYPALLYTYEYGSDGSLSHWRAMQR